ncbi:MAG: PaaI family thioesterase [Bacteroidetes bacterium]|nr:MAG: PaaI family thioesterase [Bacteroidota bacterium]
MEPLVFQDYMPDNICFGCGTHNAEGLQIRSHWEGEESVCRWHSEPKYQGWKNVLNGGILASLIDCHCMGTAMAAAYRAEGRGLDSRPVYRYATGTLNVRYLLPTPNDQPIELRARVQEIKGRKTTLRCDVFAGGQRTATAEVIAIRVTDSEAPDPDSAFEQ